MSALPVDLTILLLAALQLLLTLFVAHRVAEWRLPFHPMIVPLEPRWLREAAGAGCSRRGGSQMQVAEDADRDSAPADAADEVCMELLEQELEDIAASDAGGGILAALQEQREAVDNTRSVAQAALEAAQQVSDACRGLGEQQALMASQMHEMLSALERLEERVRSAAEHRDKAQTQETEQAEAGSRIGIEPVPEVPAQDTEAEAESGRVLSPVVEVGDAAPIRGPQAEPQRSGAARPAPRIISRESRRKLGEVLELWRQGRSVHHISMMTGLDSAEIELIVSGEPDASAGGR